LIYQKHIFVCINQRAEGAPRICCGEKNGTEIVARFKTLIMEHKLKMSVRAQRASCFDWCEKGPIVTIYPECIVYGGITPEHVNEIFESHILNNTPVARLLVNFSKK
jgi:(2Fe-2S) ferredoxin